MTRLLTTILVVSALLTACTAAVAPSQRESGLIQPGAGVFTFDAYPPLADRPVRVFYDAPADPSTAQILIVMHGVERNAQEYLADWHEQVQTHNVLVLAPEFTDESYPDAEGYNLGNMIDKDGNPQPEDRRSFHIIEALFDLVVRDVGSNAENYALFGHSAGAQFVHRFVEFTPNHRARVAVAANAGWYTTLDDSVSFPYGLNGAPGQRALPSALASNLVILLGADDIDSDSDSLRRNDAADAQGRTRLERGLNFYLGARMRAEAERTQFRWRLTVVPGVSHAHQDMAAVAAPLLLSEPA